MLDAFDRIRLEDIADVSMGQAPESQYVADGLDNGAPFLQGNAEFGPLYPTPSYSCSRPARLCRAGDVLVSVRAPVGEINIADRDYCIGRGLSAVRFRQVPTSLGAKLIAHHSGALRRVAQGTTFKAVGRVELGALEIPLAPPRERLLIAKILDTLDTQIRRTEGLIAKLEQIKQGLLTDLLTRGIDENGQLRPSPDNAPHLYRDSPVGQIPKTWTVGPILELVDLPSGQVSPLAAEYRDMPLIAPDHIESGTGKLIRVESAAEQAAISGKYLVYPGDIVYSKIRPYLKKAWIAEFPGLCSADMYPLRPRHGHSSTFILATILGTNFTRFASAVSMRTGIPKINKDELSVFNIAVPSAEEQVRIERMIAAVDRRLQVEGSDLEKLRQEKIGLMDDLLTGRVRVTPLLNEDKWAAV